VALRPCTICRRLYRGPAQHAYPALLRGTDRRGRQLSLCASCFGGLKVFAVDHLSFVNYDAPPDADENFGACAWCAEEVVSDKWTLFVTIYERGAERRDYFGMAHDACTEHLMLGLGFGEQGQLEIAS
jgi:hypothetical protein